MHLRRNLTLGFNGGVRLTVILILALLGGMNADEAANIQKLITSFQRNILKLQCQFEALQYIFIEASQTGVYFP